MKRERLFWDAKDRDAWLDSKECCQACSTYYATTTRDGDRVCDECAAFWDRETNVNRRAHH